MDIRLSNIDHIDIGDMVAVGNNVDKIDILNISRSGSSYIFDLKITKFSQKMKDMLTENNNYCYLYLCKRCSSTHGGPRWSVHARGRKTIHKYIANDDMVWRIRIDNRNDCRLQVPVEAALFF